MAKATEMGAPSSAPILHAFAMPHRNMTVSRLALRMAATRTAKSDGISVTLAQGARNGS